MRGRVNGGKRLGPKSRRIPAPSPTLNSSSLILPCWYGGRIKADPRLYRVTLTVCCGFDAVHRKVPSASCWHSAVTGPLGPGTVTAKAGKALTAIIAAIIAATVRTEMMRLMFTLPLSPGELPKTPSTPALCKSVVGGVRPDHP